MRLWTFLRPFPYDAQRYVLEVSLTFSKTQARLFRDEELLAEQSHAYTEGPATFVFNLPHGLTSDLPNPSDEVLGAVSEGVHGDSGESNQKRSAQLMAGFDNGGSLAIAVTEGGRAVYESHPGRSLQVDRSSVQTVASEEAPGGLSVEQMTQLSQRKWQRNKYSIYADMALGALFFIVGKVTEDLALAALIGAGAGLLLVAAQRFVKVDLLGGFAVFGTIMLLISAAFSLALQDDYWVQMKGTVLGLLTASLFMIDGLLRRGAYFGARIERYMPLPLHHDRIAIGMSLVGVVMAVANYYVANHFTEDFWLTWTTFLDLPLSMALFYAVIFWARKRSADEPYHGS
jgi:intracellular septation protein A|tara:strand:+ start:1314 stop:2345 length:1032 start_codon:yes stop_codon:yes gene_type:complete